MRRRTAILKIGSGRDPVDQRLLADYIVHMRHPIEFFKKSGRHFFIFQLLWGQE
jgi:hypothetical protein